MEFVLVCPNDGSVDLGLEDISAVVFRGPEQIDVIFTCPTCGTSLRAELRIPNLLLTALELSQYAEDDEGVERVERARHGVRAEADEAGLTAAPALPSVAERERREHDGAAYCAYFHWELERIESVEDLLAELGE